MKPHMSWLSKITEKSWENPGEIADLHNDLSVRPAGKTGLYLFLAVVTSMFLLFSVSHQMRMTYGDWVKVSEPGILWLNTLLLILASISLQLSVNRARTQSLQAMKWFLLTAILLTTGFILGQLQAWREMLAAGLYAQNNASYAFFYMFTAIHALHLLGGMWFLSRAGLVAFSEPDSAALPDRLGLCAVYWHFLLLVWFLLFYLLLSS
jgi:cytochrome c oxidase subunit 3